MSKKIWNKIFKSKSKTLKSSTVTGNKIHKRCSIYEEYQQLNASEFWEKQEEQQQDLKTNENEKITTKAPTNDELPLPAVVAAAGAPTNIVPHKTQSTFSKVVNSLTLKRNSKDASRDSSSSISNSNSSSGSSTSYKQTKAANKLATTSQNNKNTNSEFIHVDTLRSIPNTSNTRSSQILIVVNKLICDENVAASSQCCSNATKLDAVQLTITKATNLSTNQHQHVKKNTYSPNNNNNIIATSDDPDSNISLKLTPCPICSRTFNPATLQKHVSICEKMATKKRNIFDSSRQRREGTELASYPLPKNYGLPPVKHDRGQSPKPMQLSSPILTRKKPVDELARTTVRASVRKHTSTTPTTALATAAGMHTMTTPPSTALTSNFSRDRLRSSERSLSKRIQPPAAEQCPYCERCFGVKAYDRHVEWCKEKALQASIKLTTKSEQNVAKERLEARTKYRAPCLKTKRSINRDKYAGLTGDENDSVDSPKSGNSTNNNSNNIMSLSLTSSIMSDTTVPKHGTSNGAYNNRNSSSNKTNASNNHSNNTKTTACHAEQTLSMPTHANKKDHLIRRSTEREVPDFRLNGEQCETTSDKRKKDASTIEHADDFNNVAVNDVSVVVSRRRTLASKTSMNGTQDNQIEILTNDRNDLLATLTSTTTTTAPLLLTKSLTSLSRRKLKTKEHSATNLSITKQGPASEDVSSVAVSTKIVSTNEPKGKELQPSVSLPHLLQLQQQQQQRQPQENSIFELPQYTKLKTTMSTTALSVHTKLETNPIKGPIICRPKRKKLQRQQSATSAPLKAIPLLKESIETFGLPANTMNLVDKDKEIKIIKAPPSLARLKTPPTLMRNKSFILSGHLEGYDPFLSAKRQLEDLCSPSTPSSPQRTFSSSSQTPKTPKTPNTTNISLTACTSPSTQASRMTSSLMSTSQHSSYTPNGQCPNSNLASKSNFRRTSSLRGPRHSPMLSSRPIFTQKQRPTIQRGLSDEGPISTNFLKPEEYDEMPVRAVCVNDFALTNSPRVLRRDTSSSNRKHNLKLNVSATNSTQVSPSINPRCEEGIPSTSKYVSKTDSLAVFLKYENEVEKLPGTGIPLILSESPVITKELKDKSNTLSKQNSAKNIISEAQDSLKRAEEQQNSSNWLPDPIENQHYVEKPFVGLESNNENLNPSNKFNQIRLEPMSKNVTKPPTPQSKPTTPLYKPATPIFSKKSVLPTPNVATATQPIKLTSIFGDSKSKDSKVHDSSSVEFIDPKLINKCDNLPVSVSAGRTVKHPDVECSVTRSECSSSSSESSRVPATTSKSLKLLPSHTKVESHKIASISNQTKSNQPISLPSHRNSSDGRNLLKRKIRLGRNQFLYDESPETDCCSADDEANRSSVEYDDRNFPANNLRHTQFLYQQPNIPTPIAPPTIPPLPIFDDFDFEEFLSSFQNDDDQFPLFKDCREFLMNRTSNKQRSTVTSNSDSTRNNNNNTNPHAQTSKQSPTYNPTTFPLFPIDSLNNRQYTDPVLTTSSYRTKSNLDSMESTHNATFTNYDVLKSARSTEDFDGVDSKKREIFISIETEQNDQGRSAISPDSLRSIVGGNQKPHVEEVSANDNKFSKIEDDDDRMPTSPTSTQAFFEASQLPNIQLNNAKNLIQKMQDSFRQMGEAAGANLRQAVINSTPRSATTSNSFCENIRSPLSTERSEVAGNVDGGAVEADSDDASSLESYPVSSQSSRRGVASKLSADSAYGSLSRQRSSDFSNLNRNQIRSRPSTSNCATNTAMAAPMIDAATQHQQQQQQQKPQQHQQYYNVTTTRNRSRQLSADSSTSGSDVSLPPLVANNQNHCNISYQEQQLISSQQQQQQHQQQQIYDNNLNNNTYLESPLNSPAAPSTTATASIFAEEASAAASSSLGASTPASCSSGSINNSSMTSSMKMSRFCHECGTRFLIEQAKFCMDCGVKRIVL